jgi:hypothetical protein
MISDHTPRIRTISDPLDNFKRLRSLIDQVAHEIEMILWRKTHMLTECYKLVIATMDITDEESSLHRLFLRKPRDEYTRLRLVLFPVRSSCISSFLKRHS